MRDLHFNTNTSGKDRTNQKENALKSRPRSVLEAFEYIVELAEDSNLSDEFFNKAGRHIRYGARKIKLTPMQTVMLALFIDRSALRRKRYKRMCEGGNSIAGSREMAV